MGNGQRTHARPCNARANSTSAPKPRQRIEASCKDNGRRYRAVNRANARHGDSPMYNFATRSMLALVLTTSSAFALSEKPYITKDDIDIAVLLPSPPVE